ncbi:putative glutathione S-transferase GSTU6 [Zea mays]|uniref:Glutathione S-transferase n=2 Tax=Zea mays TaxID=4577 RepID=A0A3L6D6G4_MAIZE|nr:putative glutathione S-transferase GSTU6 [Zea mays]PWZ31822.1 putative glutathione S-transferase GSTU6 [Zea mays]
MADGGELQLLGSWYSPYVIRAKVALGLKGLSYEFVEEDLSRKSDLLLKLNPVQEGARAGPRRPPRVRVARHPAVRRRDLAGTGTPLLPADAYDRAMARFWAAYVDDKFYKEWNRLFWSTTAEKAAERSASSSPWETLEQAFRECSKGKPFFGGDAVGLVDIALGSFVVWIRVVDEAAGVKLLDEAKFPALTAWAERFLAGTP